MGVEVIGTFALWEITGPGIRCYGFDLPEARWFIEGTVAERRSPDGTVERLTVSEVSGAYRYWTSPVVEE